MVKSQSGWYHQYCEPSRRLNCVYFLNDQTGWIVGDDGIIVKTTDGGNEWKTLTVIPLTSFGSVFFINANTGWISGGYWGEYNVGVLYKTTDSGLTWDNEINNHESFFIYSIYFKDEQTGWALDGTDNFGWRVLKSTNGGLNWNYLYSGHYLSSISFLNESTAWAFGCNPGATQGAVLKTTNGGLTWVDKFVPETDQFNSGCFVSENVGYGVGIDGSICKTTNGGKDWFKQSRSRASLNAVQFINENTGWAVGFDGILKTTNGGIDWGDQNITNQLIWSVDFINENTGWVVGNSGLILKTTDSGGSINMVPRTFTLYQNYPNPFNPKTRIKFYISDYSATTIIVYDMLGKIVSTIANGYYGPGKYEADFDASNLSSGIYFYRMQSGTFTDTKKMILIK